jgi:hypothetical protein
MRYVGPARVLPFVGGLRPGICEPRIAGERRVRIARAPRSRRCKAKLCPTLIGCLIQATNQNRCAHWRNPMDMIRQD